MFDPVFAVFSPQFAANGGVLAVDVQNVNQHFSVAAIEAIGRESGDVINFPSINLSHQDGARPSSTMVDTGSNPPPTMMVDTGSNPPPPPR